MRKIYPAGNLTALAMSVALLLAFPAYGQDQPIVNPVDPLAKSATPVIVPNTLLERMELFQTPESVEKAYPLPQDPKTIAAVRTTRFKHLNDDALGRYNKAGNAVGRTRALPLQSKASTIKRFSKRCRTSMPTAKSR